jgi:hypothetical protein
MDPTLFKCSNYELGTTLLVIHAIANAPRIDHPYCNEFKMSYELWNVIM